MPWAPRRPGCAARDARWPPPGCCGTRAATPSTGSAPTSACHGSGARSPTAATPHIRRPRSWSPGAGSPTTSTAAARSVLEGLLNGPGQPRDANAGPLHELDPSFVARFGIVEDDNPFGVAIAIVAAGGSGARTDFLDYVRAVHLIWPLADGDAVHQARLLAPVARADQEHLRGALRAGFSFEGDAATAPAVAPALAQALSRVSRCRAALDVTAKWPIRRAQHPANGSRYELGLGVDLAPPPATELDALGTALQDPNRVPASDREVESLLVGMTPVPSSQDPHGRWLLEPCGLRTVHPVDAQRLYLSHLPAFGMVIEGPTQVSAGGPSAIVGDFAATIGPSTFVVYDRNSGRAELWQRGATAILERVTTLDVGDQWTQVLAVTVQAGEIRALFYDAAAGVAELRRVEPAMPLVRTARHEGLATGATHAVAGRLTATAPAQALLLYDAASGDVQCYAFDGDASATEVGQRARLPRDATHVAVFGPTSGSELDQVVLYTAGTGVAQLHDPDDTGGFVAAGTVQLRPSLTHLVAGRFGSFLTTDLLGYDAVSGFARVYGDGPSGFGALRDLPLFPLGLAHLAAADIGESTQGFLLFDAGTGRARVGGYFGGDSLSIFGDVELAAPATPSRFEVSFRPPGDGDRHAALATALAAAAVGWTAAGRSPFVVLSRTDAATALGRVVADATATDVFNQANLPAVQTPSVAVERLAAVSSALYDTLRLDATLAQAILGGGGAAELRALTDVLRHQHLDSALPLVTQDGDVLLVTGVVGLPFAGLNLSERRSTGFRWYAVPLQGPPPRIRPAGSSTDVRAAAAGLFALVALGYARRGRSDPYEVRIEMPQGARLSLPLYEFLMNLLDRAHPAGVSINTFEIRTEHVDPTGTGVVPLGAGLSRTFRRYQSPRLRGLFARDH
jgi:hypothetical protein